MKDKQSEKKNNVCPGAILIYAVVALVVCLALGFIMYCHYNKADDRINNLSKQYSDIELQFSNGAMSKYVSADPNLDFLKEEIKNHQDFIERERQFLIWMLGVIALIAIGVLGFLGYKTRKDMKESIETKYGEEYGRQFEKHLAKAAGDDSNLTYLKEAVKTYMHARSKKILFFTKENPKNSTLSPQIELFKEFMRDGDGEVLAVPFDERELNRLDQYGNYDIFVYEVSEEENGNEVDNKDFAYRKIDLHCSRNKELGQQCVFYCGMANKKPITINLAKIDSTCSTTVQFVAKLRETLYLLLYFSP